jgi:purine-binding chemotaxis protein CheW
MIKKMIEITRIHNAPSAVEGAINLRGNLIPIVDLRKRLGFDERSFDRSTRIVVVDLDCMVLGFIVDLFSEVLRISEKTVEPPPPLVSGIHSECIEEVGEIGE